MGAESHVPMNNPTVNLDDIALEQNATEPLKPFKHQKQLAFGHKEKSKAEKKNARATRKRNRK